ncbi:ribosomal 60S subunit protein L22A [Starmerella bacillaris]|uniref:Large ribosomal subunit protein eL22 n=1 Tax=Starmerella bacillaris TaxID=1247836 RepID=A0AAV5RCD6_STABA|nr:ribosomal 60S subunit protein L22A [Starmerella bacillaris]
MAPVTSKSGKQAKKVVIDVTNANSDGSIIVVDELVKYFKEHIKIDNRTGELENKINITSSGEKITITAYVPFSGKYAKYLTKRYLKKKDLRDWLRVVATGRSYFEVRFFNLDAGEDEEEEESDDE